MYSRNSFGSYYPIDSTIHKLNPIIKLVNFLLIIILIILSNSIYINGFILILLFILMMLSFVPFKYYFNTFWSLRYIYILVAFICAFLKTDMNTCIVILMKIVIVVEYLNVLAFTTSPSESVYAIEKTLSIFNIFSLPLSNLALKINMILRYIPLYLGVEYKIFKASSSRGIDYNHSNIFGRIYAYSKVHSNIRSLVKRKNRETLLNSELRMYDVKKYRTNYRTNKVTFSDIFLLIFHISLFYAYFVESGIL